MVGLATGLSTALVAEGLLTHEQVDSMQHAIEEKNATLTPGTAATTFLDQLIQSAQVSAYDLARAMSRQFGIPMFDLDVLNPDLVPEDILSGVHKENAREVKGLEAHCEKLKMFPLFYREPNLFLGVVDPTNMDAQRTARFMSGHKVLPVLVEQDKLNRLLEGRQKGNLELSGNLGDIDISNVGVAEIPGEGDDEASDATVTTVDSGKDAGIVAYVNKILMDAINKGVSDVHFEPYEKYYRIRYRQDGMLQEVARPPVHLGSKIAARIKVMARLDISERRVPQDGRVRLSISKTQVIDLRTSTCPTVFGEKVVMRVLDPSSILIGLENLGFSEGQQKLFVDAIHRPYGMVLVTGPTGSGKTVTLYTGLNMLNTMERNISTAEDPAEINLPGANQVNMNPRAGLTFSETLRSFLRQDPDIIMVGEIRDLETAEIAIKAAQTGHLVMSTLHTNDATQTLDRLGKMGVESFNIASAVHLIIAQRLARRLCKLCKKPVKIPDVALQELGFDPEMTRGHTLYQAVGCEQCNGGYRGRVGLYEVLPISDRMKEMILDHQGALELSRQARKEGYDDLRTDGFRKVLAGTTSLEELNRVTSE